MPLEATKRKIKEMIKVQEVCEKKIHLDKLEKNFPADTKFCTLVLDGNSFRTSEIVVVGSFEKFCRRLEAPKL